MKLYAESRQYKLYLGDMQDMSEVINPMSIDCIVTDPPYGLTVASKRNDSINYRPEKESHTGQNKAVSGKGFMGKEWDGSGVEYDVRTWKACYEVLKPGGYLLAFGGTRTSHRIASAIEDAGFEIRDTIAYIYGSGLPKSEDISKAIDRRAGAKRKVVGQYVKTDAHRYEGNHVYQSVSGRRKVTIDVTEPATEEAKRWSGWGTNLKPAFEPVIVARKPPEGSALDNVLKYGVGGINIDECRINRNGEEIGRKGKSVGPWSSKRTMNQSSTPPIDTTGVYDARYPSNLILSYDDETYNDVCGDMPINKGKPVSRYFYCAKANAKDRDEGTTEGNNHPTVKNTELMQYLIRLVAPKGRTILDPFMGSGTTGKAAMYENNERDAGYKFIGIDITDEYMPIAKERIDFAISKGQNRNISLFDSER